MQGVLIASANIDVRKTLVAIVQNGRTVYECRSISECLTLAAAQKFDYIFIDDIFEDGGAQDLVRDLNRLGYGVEIIPVLLTDDPLHLRAFDSYGVKHFVQKPFDIGRIERVIAQIEAEADLQETSRRFMETSAPAGETSPRSPPTPLAEWQLGQEVDVREISQRFRRLVRKVSSREELIAAFSDSMREQFDVDNVVILLPSERTPDYRVSVGHVAAEIRDQFYVPLNEPLVAALVRLGEPVWVQDCDRLGRQNAVTAMRYGERLNIQVLCPVLSRGRLLGLVGLSRFHRYEHSPYLVSLLRLFLSFFSEALENTQLYEQASAAGETYRGILGAIPVGTVAVSPIGRILHVNAAAESFLNATPEELEGQPVERVGSHFADIVRETLQCGTAAHRASIPVNNNQLQARAVPMPTPEGAGALVILEQPAVIPPQDAPAQDQTAKSDDELWQAMAGVMAHNFKNAIVPVKTCAELLPERYDSAAFRNSFFEVVNDNVRRMDGWIEQLLRYAHVRSGHDNWGIIELHTCIESAADTVFKAYAATNVGVNRDWDQKDTVRGNPKYLENAFAALIQNALDAVQDVANPVITLRTTISGDQVKALVSDNGPGFDMSSQQTAFSAFSTSKLSGLGLGLAYVQRVVDVHEGRVEITTSSDAGTAVELSLPVHQSAPVIS